MGCSGCQTDLSSIKKKKKVLVVYCFPWYSLCSYPQHSNLIKRMWVVFLLAENLQWPPEIHTDLSHKHRVLCGYVV